MILAKFPTSKFNKIFELDMLTYTNIKYNAEIDNKRNHETRAGPIFLEKNALHPML